MEAGLAAWRVKQMQLEAARVATAKAAQSKPTMGSVLGGRVEADEEDMEEDLPPVLHKAYEAPRLRALNEVLGVELQPEELLLQWEG